MEDQVKPSKELARTTDLGAAENAGVSGGLVGRAGPVRASEEHAQNPRVSGEFGCADGALCAEGMDRRRFYIAAIYGLWSLIGAALALPASIYLFFPPSARQKEEFVDLGEISQFPAGVPEEKVFRQNRKDGWRLLSEKATAWVTRVSDREVVAFAPQCTHLGCAYHWDEQKQNFLCPCHTSTFGLDGRVLSGPAPRALDRYQVRIEKGKLLLGSIVQRAEEIE